MQRVAERQKAHKWKSFLAFWIYLVVVVVVTCAMTTLHFLCLFIRGNLVDLSLKLRVKTNFAQLTLFPLQNSHSAWLPHKRKYKHTHPHCTETTGFSNKLIHWLAFTRVPATVQIPTAFILWMKSFFCLPPMPFQLCSISKILCIYEERKKELVEIPFTCNVYLR